MRSLLCVKAENIEPEVLTSASIFLAYASRDFDQQRFLAWNSPIMPFLPSLLLIVDSWTLTLGEASAVVQGLFHYSQFGGPCAPGMIPTTPISLRLWIMVLNVVLWKWLGISFQTDGFQPLCFSFVLKCLVFGVMNCFSRSFSLFYGMYGLWNNSLLA